MNQISWLPKKLLSEDRIAKPLCEVSFNKGRIVGFNQALDLCLSAYQQAVKDGKVCEVPSVEDIENIILNFGGMDTPNPTEDSFECATAIYNELKKRLGLE